MIADDNDDRVLAIDRLEKTSDLRVDELNFAVVRLRIRRRRRIRRVRVIQMYPHEERTRVALLQPRERTIDGDVAAAFRLEHVRFIRRIARNLVVVNIESAIESEAAIEDE